METARRKNEKKIDCSMCRNLWSIDWLAGWLADVREHKINGQRLTKKKRRKALQTQNVVKRDEVDCIHAIYARERNEMK